MSTPPSDLPLYEDPTAWGGRTFNPPIQLDIATIQTAIVDQLSSAFEGTPIGVFGFPNLPPTDWWKRKNAIGYFLVAYKRTDYGKPLSTASMVQERTLEFEIHTIARQIAWGDFTPFGVFQAMLQVGKGALTGFRVPGCHNGYFVSEEFLQQDPQGRIWDYAFKYRVITMEVKKPNEGAAALGILKKIQYLETGGLTPVPVAAALYTFGSNGVLQLPSQNVSAVTVINLPTKQPYVLDTDYTVQMAQGTLTLVTGGAIQPGETVSVSYSAADVVTTNEQGGPVPFYPSN
jgi:Gp37 protein